MNDMKNLHILIPRHYDFNSSHHSSIWLESIMPQLSKNFSVQITWFYYSPIKIKKPMLKNNENVIQIQDFKNAVEIIQKIQPDLILDSEFPTLIDLSFLAAAKNNSFYVRKYSNHRMFKVPLKLRSTFSHLNEKISFDENQKQSTTRKNFFFYKYRFFLKSLFASNLTFFEKIHFLMISLKWNLITEHPLINPKIQADLELLNSNSLKEILLKKGYSNSKLVVAGNPMFDNVFKKRNNLQTNSDKKLKILFAPFQYYGETHKDFQEKITKEIIKQITSQKNEFSLVVKLHPSFHDFGYFKKLISSIDESVPIFQKGSIEKYIDDSDILISNGIVSSSAIYGLILKKPVIFCDFYDLYSYDEYKNIIIECRYSTKLVNILLSACEINSNNLEQIEKFLKQHYFKTDGLASERVVNAIKQLVDIIK